MHVQDANRVGAQDTRYQVMSALYKQHSKLESYKEQGLPVEKWVYYRDSLTKKLVREGFRYRTLI
jgi:hypothetical protein